MNAACLAGEPLPASLYGFGRAGLLEHVALHSVCLAVKRSGGEPWRFFSSIIGLNRSIALGYLIWDRDPRRFSLCQG